MEPGDRIYLVVDLRTDEVCSVHPTEEQAEAAIVHLMRTATTTVSYYISHAVVED